MDTIYAQASARGKAGVAIIRLSGPAAWDVAGVLAGSIPSPRVAGLRKIVWNGDVLDEAILLCFEKDASFTGERVVELHVHGSVATISAILRALSEFEDVRLAEPGEFTRRALENGRLDLAQVEGLSDLIDAETESQRKQALGVLSGAIGDKVDSWRRNLVRAAALLEVTIDFVDEDVPVDVYPEVIDLIDFVLTDLQTEAAGIGAAERIREGYEVAIVGHPNSGKSTLLNRLAGREAAITSEIAGTTRDVIEVKMNLNGFSVTLLDTAGLRESADHVENIGINRAILRANDADLRVFLLDDSPITEVKSRPGDILIAGKGDLRKSAGFSVSGLTGTGIEELVTRISEVLSDRAAHAGIMSHERHRLALNRSVEALTSAKNMIYIAPENVEISAQLLHEAIHGLEMLVGRVDVENYLDEIFSSFCIGK